MRSSKGQRSRKSSKNVVSVIDREREREAPPPIPGDMMITKTFRFIATLASTGPTGIALFASAAAGTATPLTVVGLQTAANTNTAIFNSFKIKRIRVWGPPAADLMPVTVQVNWDGSSATAGVSQNAASKSVTDTSVGSSRVAHVDSKPPKDSNASFWQGGANIAGTRLCYIVCPVGAIVDIHLSLRQDFDASIEQVYTSVAAGTVGEIYLGPPDALHLLRPLGGVANV